MIVPEIRTEGKQDKMRRFLDTRIQTKQQHTYRLCHLAGLEWARRLAPAGLVVAGRVAVAGQMAGPTGRVAVAGQMSGPPGRVAVAGRMSGPPGRVAVALALAPKSNRK